MEIEVGEYVRTDNGKIIKADDKEWIELLLAGHSVFGRAYKHSPNIIDLIEVGDYVNGYSVVGKGKNGDVIINDGGFHSIWLVDIKSIVTKEQFESIEYKVEEDK